MHPVYGCRYTREARHGGLEMMEWSPGSDSPVCVICVFRAKFKGGLFCDYQEIIEEN
jgi:hypothetical protein